MRALARLGLPAAAAVGLVALAPAAWAQEAPAPERAAWFSAAGGGGLAAPQPTTQEGDLRVARDVRTQAFSALLFRGTGTGAALDLAVRDGSAAGTPDVVACPTVGVDWADGGNQPMDAAPEVDCESSLVYGLASADGATLSFGLDAAFEVEPGAWSIALVPAPDAVVPGPPPQVPLPFALDLQRPEAGAFVLEPELPVPAAPAPSDEMVTSGSGTTGTPALGDGFAALPPSGGTTVVAAPLDPAVAPPAAAAAVPVPVTLVSPVALRPASHGDEDAGRRLLALLALAGGSAAVGYAAGQSRPGPRLIGGRARLGGSAAVATAPAQSTGRPRGIGRFARERDTPPPRLR